MTALILAGRFLEARAKRRSGAALRALLSLGAKDVTVLFEHLNFALEPGPIHGDAHTRNLFTDHGQVVLIDFEAAAIGPREWGPDAYLDRGPAVRAPRRAVSGVRRYLWIRCG